MPQQEDLKSAQSVSSATIREANKQITIGESLMKTYLNLFVLIAICLLTLFCTGMEGCNTEEEPAVFVSATPSDGSTIQKDRDDCRHF